MTFLMAQANFEPKFSCINTLTILKPSYYSSYLAAYEDGIDRVFRNVGIQNSEAGELPRRKYTTDDIVITFHMFLFFHISDVSAASVLPALLHFFTTEEIQRNKRSEKTGQIETLVLYYTGSQLEDFRGSHFKSQHVQRVMCFYMRSTVR
jgi:hypothetical protein